MKIIKLGTAEFNLEAIQGKTPDEVRKLFRHMDKRRVEALIKASGVKESKKKKENGKDGGIV